MTLEYDLNLKAIEKGPANWLLEMREFYNKNGYYRAEDRLKLLGDPCEGVVLDDKYLKKRLLDDN